MRKPHASALRDRSREVPAQQDDSCFVSTAHQGGNENWNFLVNCYLAINAKELPECGGCFVCCGRAARQAKGRVSAV